MARSSDEEIIRTTRNLARFFTEHRQVSWVLFMGVVIWGIYGYLAMPKQKDPTIPVRIALVTCSWPGVPATQMEQLVTRPIEQTIAENAHIHGPDPRTYGIQSLTMPGYTVIRLQLADSVEDTAEQFNDINLKLQQLNSQLPQGAGPIQFNADFGETAALMLTVASPPEREVTLSLRAKAIQKAINDVRDTATDLSKGPRATLVVVFPWSVNEKTVARRLELFANALRDRNVATDIVPIGDRGFAGLDMHTQQSDEKLLEFALQFAHERLGITRFHPDAWAPVIIGNPESTRAMLTKVKGPRFSYRDLDDFTDLISRTLQAATQVSKVDRYGVLDQQITLSYSQEQLASYGLQPAKIKDVLAARNITLSGGMLEIDGANLFIDPSGQFTNPAQIGSVVIAQASAGSPVYLRDLVEISRGYQSPPNFLNYYTWRDETGQWQRSPAVTLAVQMRSGGQIADFGTAVDDRLEGLKGRLPDDLVVARTSDQPRQVREEIDLFMTALYEAVILVVLAALVGFWEWRSAVLMAFSIPTTLALTFGVMYVLGINLQQVSIASLIIALGLLVDDPVVAGDAIKRELGAGHKRSVAAWLGPTKLAKPILFATVTNIAAYLPFLLLTGNTGDFMRSLPIVMACTLIASRLVSMTFVPLLGYSLLRTPAGRELSIEEKRSHGFTGRYYRLGSAMIEHRWLSLAASFVFLALGVVLALNIKVFFFPNDREYLSYVDVWLPNNAALSLTRKTAQEAEAIVRRVAQTYAKESARDGEKPQELLESVTTFIGGGAPRFWFSLTPEQRQLNYAQLVVETFDKEATTELTHRWQQALSEELPGARADVRQLQLNRVGVPIQIRIVARTDISAGRSPEAIAALRRFGDQVVSMFDSTTGAARARNDWGEDSFVVRLQVDPDRANMAGVSNRDVAESSRAGISGLEVTTLIEGDKQIPVVARLRLDERARLSDLENLYVYSTASDVKVPLGQVSVVRHDMEPQRLHRLEQFPTLTVEAFPAQGVLPSEIMNAVAAKLQAFEESLPDGFDVIVSGAEANRHYSFAELSTILAVSVTAIFVLLTLQFNHAVKPMLVFAAVPYGMVGSLGALYVMGVPFGVMAFMGIISLVGVIVSHIIVLFDFIEANREEGEPLKESLLDAGIARLRPVMITVGATVLALVPLAFHGGPLWQPLCYAQIGGLLLATFIELLLVKVFYAIAVLDLGIIKWEQNAEG